MSTPHSRGWVSSGAGVNRPLTAGRDNREVVPLRTSVALCTVVGVSACSPSLDWREFRSPASGISLLFPCRPSTQERVVTVAGRSVRLQLHACRAENATWAMAEADVVDPAGIADALVDLRASAVANVAGRPAGVVPFDVPGATPNPLSLRGDVSGRLPDGQAVTEHVGVFTVGTRVAQVTALGSGSPRESIVAFFASVQVRR